MKVGFIGLGIMGTSMASNLIKGGHELVVHDIKRDAAAPHLAAGATWADTPRKLAEGVEVVMTSLPGPIEMESVALGKEGLFRPDHQLAQGGPEGARDLHREGRAPARRAGERRAERGPHAQARALGR